MPYFTAIEKSLSYIEEHLYEDIDLSSIAREAGYSLYHFHRIFRGIVGDSIKEYIRKRRMTEAARELASTDKAVVDIAIKYGYQSREAFSTAFEKAYGKRPSQVKRDEVSYSIREPMTIDYMMFQYKMRKIGINPVFRKMPEMTVVGERFRMKSDGSNFQRIPLLWEKWKKEKMWTDIKGVKNNNEYMGVCVFSEDTFDYIIGQEVNEGHKTPSNMTLYKIKPSYYAVFRTLGPITESVQKTWDYIYTIWLNESNYKHEGTHDIEYYYYYQGELVADLYVPVVSEKDE